jgi:DNA polymerase-3 subunit epsilon
MSLQLARPIAFFDLETTGVNLSTDRIVEVAIIKILPDGTRQVKRRLINPGIPIPQQTTDIHGITDEMVKDAPTFKQCGNELKQFIENCDMGGYNSNRFDIPMLMEEFLRAGMDVDLSTRRMIDVQHIFYTMEPRTLTAAYKFYCEKELVDAHSAEADVNATIDVLLSQINVILNWVIQLIPFSPQSEKIRWWIMPVVFCLMQKAWRYLILENTKADRW